MNAYRETIKAHFESIPAFKKALGADYLFWALGLAVCVLGGLLIFANVTASDILESLGFWVMWFGVVLAFIKKDDLGLMIPMAVMAVYEIIMFIVLLAAYRSASISNIFHFMAYGTLFILAYRASEGKRQSDLRRAQEAAVLAQHMQATGGVICGKCGTAMPKDSGFCSVCGTKKPDAEICPVCGSAVQPGAEFCAKCGVKTGTAGTVLCPRCGVQAQPTDTFCPICGTRLNP